jgi:CYTH domain-containing protein
MEIERKWLVKQLPKLKGKSSVMYERYFLYIGEKTEIRIQKKGSKYEFERKSEVSDLARAEQKFEITEDEFRILKKDCEKSIKRESYFLSEDPEISLKIYHGKYEGLIRAEVEFASENAAKSFEPLGWFGKEITHTPLGRDKLLIKLNKEEFEKLLYEHKD